jgi:hypothetical protein
VARISRGRACIQCGGDDWYQGKGKPTCAICKRAKMSKRYQDMPELWMHNNAKMRAARAGVPFDITVEDILAAWPADGRCPALGIPLVKGIGQSGYESPTLDRIVPELGYVKGNIAVLSARANLIKNDATAGEVLAVGVWLQRHNPRGGE